MHMSRRSEQKVRCFAGKTEVLAKPETKEQKKDLARIAKALGHPIRLQIIAILKNTKGCICGDIVNRLPISQATVSQHLKVLKDAGVIRGEISGPATCYCLEPATVKYFKEMVKKL